MPICFSGMTALESYSRPRCSHRPSIARSQSKTARTHVGSVGPCKQIDNAIHPDVFYIAPDGEQIKIAQIREMQDFLVYRPLIGRYKIYIVDAADRMNISAANSLLKTLEEPPGHSVIILISSRPRHLLPTIQSRCQKLRFAPLSLPEVQEAVERQQQRSAEAARLVAGFLTGAHWCGIRNRPRWCS